MASIRPTPGTNTWQVRYRSPDGRQRSKNFKKRADADRWAATVETDKLRGRYADPALAKTRCQDWILDWETTRLGRRASTRARDTSVLRNHVLPAFENRTLGSLRPVDVRQWVAQMVDKGLAPATTRKAYQLLAGALEAAVDEGLIPRSPARGVTLPKSEVREMRFLSTEEIGALADAIDPRYRVMALTAAYTGLRAGELGALQMENLNLLRRSLRVDQTLSEVKGKLSFGPPKTKTARRTVSLPQFLCELLAEHISRFGSDSGLVFSSPEGEPIRQTNFRRRFWKPAVAASVGEPCRFHDLRHSHAALLIAQGEHPTLIQQRLGHASIRTTLDTYGHLFEGLDEAAADRLGEAFQAADVVKMWSVGQSAVVELPQK